MYMALSVHVFASFIRTTFYDYHFYRYVINVLTQFEYITWRGDIVVVTSRLECGQTVATTTLCTYVYVHRSVAVRTTHVSVHDQVYMYAWSTPFSQKFIFQDYAITCMCLCKCYVYTFGLRRLFRRGRTDTLCTWTGISFENTAVNQIFIKGSTDPV